MMLPMRSRGGTRLVALDCEGKKAKTRRIDMGCELGGSSHSLPYHHRIHHPIKQRAHRPCAFHDARIFFFNWTGQSNPPINKTTRLCYEHTFPGSPFQSLDCKLRSILPGRRRFIITKLQINPHRRRRYRSTIQPRIALLVVTRQSLLLVVEEQRHRPHDLFAHNERIELCFECIPKCQS